MADTSALPNQRTEEPMQPTLVREMPNAEAQPSYSTMYEAASLLCPLGYELLTAPTEALARMVQEVVRVEAPVSTAILIRRVMDAFSLGHAGPRIASRVKEVISQRVRECGWILHDGFVMMQAHSDGVSAVPIRDRAKLPAAERKIELVSPFEIRAALLKTVELAFSIDAVAAVSEAAQLLGFGRTSSKIAAEIQLQLNHLIEAGVVLSDKEAKLSRLVKSVASGLNTAQRTASGCHQASLQASFAQDRVAVGIRYAQIVEQTRTQVFPQPKVGPHGIAHGSFRLKPREHAVSFSRVVQLVVKVILVDHIKEEDLFEPNPLMRRHPARGSVVETLEHDGTAPARLGFFDSQLHIERIALGVTPGPAFFHRRSDSKGVHQFVHVLAWQRAHGDAAL